MACSGLHGRQAVAQQHVIMRETTLVLSGGSIGSTGVVLYVERVAKEAVVETKARNVPEAFFASGEHRLGTPLGGGGIGDLLNPLPYDELRAVCHFDASLPPIRTARRQSERHNGSSAMASILNGSGEVGPLNGSFVPAIGQHVMLADGGSKPELSTGIADLMRVERRRLHANATFQQAFQIRLDSDDDAIPRNVLRKFAMADALLRDLSLPSSYRRGELFRRQFAYALGDVDGGLPAMQSLLAAMHEACVAEARDRYEAEEDGDEDETDDGFTASFLASVQA